MALMTALPGEIEFKGTREVILAVLLTGAARPWGGGFAECVRGLGALVAPGSLDRCLRWLLLSPGGGERRSTRLQRCSASASSMAGSPLLLRTCCIWTGSMSKPWPTARSPRAKMKLEVSRNRLLQNTSGSRVLPCNPNQTCWTGTWTGSTHEPLYLEIDGAGQGCQSCCVDLLQLRQSSSNAARGRANGFCSKTPHLCCD